MFSSTAFKAFTEHPGLATASPTYKLLNKPHHQDRRWITPIEVAACQNELDELVSLVDRMHEERRQWRHKVREQKRETTHHRRTSRFVRETDVALHEVVGMLFQHGISLGQGSDEAVLVEDSSLLRGIEIAYRITEESAIPLALPKQIALGGKLIPLDRFDEHEGEAVALMLDDGSSLFKRVGKSLPGDLKYLREFESIGGLGSSRTLAVGKAYDGLRSIVQARLIVGVLYQG
jgi:hypothetical protein